MNTLAKTFTIIVASVFLFACGTSGKDYSLNVHSDPLGSYALLKVDYASERTSEWIFLGTTPIIQTKKLDLENAKQVSIRVIRPGFHDSTKTWSLKDFRKEYRDADKILWIPTLVQQ